MGTMQNKSLDGLKKELMKLLKKKALKGGKFVLSSGRVSNYYLDGRLITLSPKGAYLTAAIILKMLKQKRVKALGGPTLGADPIVGAVAALSYLDKAPLDTFIVRKAAKGHGMQRQIEGPQLKKTSRVVLVDDVATTGQALIEAYQALSNIGVNVKEAIVIVDRNQGAKENLARYGIKLESIFKISEFGL
jgi:orotate phosphoribosyltransferase